MYQLKGLTFCHDSMDLLQEIAQECKKNKQLGKNVHTVRIIEEVVNSSYLTRNALIPISEHIYFFGSGGQSSFVETFYQGRYKKKKLLTDHKVCTKKKKGWL